MWRAGGVVVLAVLLTAWPGVAAAQEGPPERPDTRQVMFVGNNWEGTADILDARTFERLARINTIPDKEERLAEIQRDPVRLAFFLAIRQAVGEGNDQFTDDMFTSHDGRFVYVSRPSFADVVAISLETQQIVWRFPMEGAALGPHGDIAGRRELARVGLDGQQGAPARHGHRAQDRRVPLGRLPTREQLFEGRFADLPREHRPRLHPDRPVADPAARADPRHDQGRAVRPGSERRHDAGARARRHGPEAGGGRLSGDGVRSPADGAVTRRAHPLRPDLVPSRLALTTAWR